MILFKCSNEEQLHSALWCIGRGAHDFFADLHVRHANPGRFGPESFRPGRFGLGRFGLNLDVGRFGLFWWVVSALGRFGP